MQVGGFVLTGVGGEARKAGRYMTTLGLFLLIGALAGHPLGAILAYRWDAVNQKRREAREAVLNKARWAHYEKRCAEEAKKPRVQGLGGVRRTDIEAML